MHQTSVLIVSDDTEFARAVRARWQAEKHIPEITLATSAVWRDASGAGYDLVMVGPVREGKLASVLSSLGARPNPAVCVVADEREASSLRAQYPNLLVVPRQDGYVGTLLLISTEALRRVEAQERAQRAERLAMEAERHAVLGRYMLEMRPSVNNALTSVLGNADLLLLEPGQSSAESREQLKTIHTMGLRLNEIMQRFSSLASEMRVCEKESQAETEGVSHGAVGRR